MDFNSFSYWFTKTNRITKAGQLNMYPVFFVVDISSETQQYFCVHDLILQTHEQIYACYKKKKLDQDYIKYRFTSNKDKHGLWWLQCWVQCKIWALKQNRLRTTILFNMTFFSDLFLFIHDFFHSTLIIMAINGTGCTLEAVQWRTKLVLPHLCSQKQ